MVFIDRFTLTKVEKCHINTQWQQKKKLETEIKLKKQHNSFKYLDIF